MASAKMPVMKKNHLEVEDYGASVFDICDRYEHDTLRYRIDIDLQAYDAVTALMEGKPLSTALAFIEKSHPAAHEVRQALADLPRYEPKD